MEGGEIDVRGVDFWANISFIPKPLNFNELDIEGIDLIGFGFLGGMNHIFAP